jgi:hypothetical protein
VLLDAKLTDGRQLEQDEIDQRDFLPDDKLPEIRGAETVGAMPGVQHEQPRQHRAILLQAVQAILEEQDVEVQQLPLSALELNALESLKAAVDGREQHLGQFVYATDRRDMLEQALAVLQPNFVHGAPNQLQQLKWAFDEMQGKISELRARLTSLDDAQDELMDANAQVGIKLDGGGGDSDDELDPAGNLIVKPHETALTGPAVPDRLPQPSTLERGPELAAEQKPPSTLVGAELPPEPKPRSMLADPDPDASR